MIEVINQIEKEFKISFKEYELFIGNKFLSEENDNELLGKIFSDILYYKTKKIFEYPKSELYEVTIVMFNGKNFVLTIHDSMIIETIIEMIKEKNLSNRGYYLILNQKKYYQMDYEDENALFYNLRKFDYIFCNKEVLYG